jgi:hypothetical protein
MPWWFRSLTESRMARRDCGVNAHGGLVMKKQARLVQQADAEY